MNKTDLEVLLGAEFKANGWQFESLAKLPKAFLRKTDITPFFQPRILRRSASFYAIDGYIGFVSRRFEVAWNRQMKSASVNSHCLAFNIGNISSLRLLQEMRELDHGQVHAFCTEVSTILSGFPVSCEMACEVFEKGKVGSFDLERFIIFGRSEKLSLLKDFVCPKQFH